MGLNIFIGTHPKLLLVNISGPHFRPLILDTKQTVLDSVSNVKQVITTTTSREEIQRNDVQRNDVQLCYVTASKVGLTEKVFCDKMVIFVKTGNKISKMTCQSISRSSPIIGPLLLDLL